MEKVAAVRGVKRRPIGTIIIIITMPVEIITLKVVGAASIGLIIRLQVMRKTIILEMIN
jgi:hypothetical protein